MAKKSSKEKSGSKEKSDKKKKSTKLEVRLDKFKGQKQFAIWEVDKETGKDVNSFPIISIGERKARAIMHCLPALQEFVDEIKASKNEEKTSKKKTVK